MIDQDTDRPYALLESWLNGNRKNVVDELRDGPRVLVAEFTSLLAYQDEQARNRGIDDGPTDCQVFLRMFRGES